MFLNSFYKVTYYNGGFNIFKISTNNMKNSYFLMMFFLFSLEMIFLIIFMLNSCNFLLVIISLLGFKVLMSFLIFKMIL